MDEGQEKRGPGGFPADAPLSPERVREAMADPKVRRTVQVRLTISGGLPEEVQHLAIAVDGGGKVEFALDQAGADRRSGTGRTKEDAVMRLLEDADGLARAVAARPARIPPDSLVGRLEVSIGEETQEIVFMADPEQAKTAGFPMPATVERMMHQLIEIGGTAAGNPEAFARML